ncbi:uncharacterized protein K452DRAFT_328053 [Aplosporella prunicola CBS 121167]|uniref:Mediator of RNA polymerase II transcription subunit 10 n=1 Tax=Aplosporella prunicola CBS 121167 TaxID=1176127 RepID=A0A6A6B8U2_9PEZI|nr:uncharacterized protein K452DRAFT_328053 [Aplosporella prunicola CBS 121167]KAF2139624.1 hypothetical protein K452DRAFT_328053 [Aplosporella prunicola CBS 121167]
MAPDNAASLNQIDEQLKIVVQNLFNLVVDVHDHQGSATEEAMKAEATSLLANLLALSRRARALSLSIPPEIITYVENGRNPDIYTREFAELVQKNNQKLKAKAEAFAQFRDILAGKIGVAFPDMRDDVARVVRNTGGDADAALRT